MNDRGRNLSDHGDRGRGGGDRGRGGSRVSDSSSESSDNMISLMSEYVKRKRVRDNHECDRGDDRNRQHDFNSFSGNEFVLSDKQFIHIFHNNHKLPDYLNRKFDVPASYFNQDSDQIYNLGVRDMCVK